MKKQVIVYTAFLFAFVNVLIAQKMTVKDSDSNVLMEVNDEGTLGSITLPSGAAPLTTTNKLYNVGGTLYWNGNQLGTAGSAGGWTDDGTVVVLTDSTDKVGIGISSPDLALDVKDSLGINGTRLLYLPDQSVFEGTLYVGDGGCRLIHTDYGEGVYNTAVGISALYANTTGSFNTAIGYCALISNKTSSSNTAIGNWALYFNTGGSDNIAIGSWTLVNQWTADCNTAIGSGALFSHREGDNNTAIGSGADFNNQYGSNNTIIGSGAGHGITEHDKSGNVFIGYQAGYSAAEAANRNIFIGYQAGYSETDSSKLYIENSNSPSPLIGGDFSTDRVGINTNNPSCTLDVSAGDAIMVPVGTTAQRPSSPSAGMIRFNSTNSKFEGYTGTVWINLH